MKSRRWFLGVALLLLSVIAIGCSETEVSPRDRKHQFYRVLWSKNLDPVYDSGNLPISFHSPLIHDGLLFLGSPTGLMTAYNVENGRDIWKKKEATAVSNQAAIVDDNVIYGTVEGRLVCRNYATGELKYEADVGDAVESTVIFDRGRGFVQLRNYSVLAFDASTGKTLWSYKRSVSQNVTIQQVGTPAIYNGRLYVGFADGVLAAFSLDDGKLLWENNLAEGTKFIDVNMTPAFKGKLLYAGSLSGPLSILNNETGELVHKYPYQVSRTPFWMGDDFIVGTYQGDVVLTNTEGVVKQTLPLNSTIFAITKVKEHMAAATRDGRVVFFDPKTLKTLDTFNLGHEFSLIFGHLIADENKVAMFSSRNRLYVLELLQ